MADGAHKFGSTPPAGPSASASGDTVAGERLKLFIERIETLEEDKRAVAAEIKDVYAEAKGEGYDAKIMRQVVRLRKMERHERQEQEALLELYLAALGEG